MLALGVGALIRFQRGSAPEQAGSGLTVYCAAGLREPVAALAEEYRLESGTQVHLQYGGSANLLSVIRVSQRGDLYIMADDGTLEDARRLDLVRESIPLAQQQPVIAVQGGNPKRIHTLADLLRQDVRVALTNPETASNGRIVRQALGEEWARLAAHAAVTKPTVPEIASDLSLGAVDAAMVWDSTVPQFPGLEAVAAPELAGRTENASITVLAACLQPAAALRFARFLAAPEKGGAVFAQRGFHPVAGDTWAERPELILYSGGVNRPAIEKLLQEFGEREGVNVTTVFNGCGILCASMQALGNSRNPQFPDAYYACDLCYLPPVAAHFPEAAILTETDIVIAVHQGNPQGVHSLADLARPGLRVGVSNAEQSTLGYMTAGMLHSTGLQEAVRRNVVVEVPTADFLINQIRAGALDAIIVYRVNVDPVAEYLEAISIDHPGAKAAQPFSIRVDSSKRQLAGRLLDFFRAHRQRFEQAGFRWRGNEPSFPSESIEIPPWLRAAGVKKSTPPAEG